ncbi:MAG: MBL fold metallo-hydrolase [Alphaproteobacteria bacterium]|nr:MBL fold metallo-hydrolase [Alphaproteobacteria bacterium]
MRAVVLGSGGATGVPMIGRGWGKCDPSNPKNRRKRPSLLVQWDNHNILIDTSPDLRQQLLDADVSRLDALLYTHAHADHVHGVDDIRDVNRCMHDWIDAYADEGTLKTIQERFAYVFEPQHPDAKLIYKPLLRPHIIDGPFQVAGHEIVPIALDHGYSTSLGFRFGSLAYTTDVVRMEESSFKALEGVGTWIVSCTVDFPHETHAELNTVLEWIERIKPKRAVLTHLSFHFDYEALKARLPDHVEPAYDGMVIDVSG